MKTFKSKFAKMAFVVGLAAGIANPVFADDSKTLPIAAQMYTLRNAGTLEEQLAILNRAGVSAVETVDMQKVSASELNALLEKHKIKVISSHVPIDKLRGNLDEVITEQKAVGNPVVTVPFLKPEDRPKDAAGWTAFGKELGGYADKLASGVNPTTLSFFSFAISATRFISRSTRAWRKRLGRRASRCSWATPVTTKTAWRHISTWSGRNMLTASS